MYICDSLILSWNITWTLLFHCMEPGSEIASIIMALNMTWNLRIQWREIFLEITRFLQSWIITQNWKYYTHETQIKCLVKVSCEYSWKQMNVKENSIFFAVWDFSSYLVSEQVGFTSICAVVKCLVACTRSMWDTKGPKVIVDGQDLEHGQVLTTWLMGVTHPRLTSYYTNKNRRPT